jgi:hypothetical protein
MTNPMTTTADVIYSSSGSTPARLGIGTANQVLAVNAGATAPEWQTIVSGGMTLLSTTTLSGATTTISSISGAYKKLYCIIDTPQNSTADGLWRCRPNGTENSRCAGARVNLTTTATFYSEGDIPLSLGLNTLRSNGDSYAVFEIDNYASTAITRKGINGWSTFRNDSNSGNIYGVYGGSFYIFEDAITSLVFSNTGGDASAGTVYLYGVN